MEVKEGPPEGGGKKTAGMESNMKCTMRMFWAQASLSRDTEAEIHQAVHGKQGADSAG